MLKMLNPLRTQVRVVRLGTPPDFEDGLVEVRNRRLGSVILSYHQLAALINQAKDGPWYAIQKNYARRSTHTTIEVLAYD